MKKVYCLLITSLLFIAVTNAQVIKGQVTTAEGEPAYGATVLLKNTFNRTITDKKGQFQLTVQAPGNYTLSISFVGFESIELETTVAEKAISNYHIVLHQSISSLKEITVTANRKEEIVDRTPASVQIINSREIQAQSAISPNLSNILGHTIPSLGLSSNTTSNTGQTLRGRTPLILIDGIPQSTPLRNGSRDMRTIDPSVIERIEVIKGATAIYGNGADGGVINYITTQPKTADKVEAYSTIAKTGMVAHAAGTGGIRAGQRFSGKVQSFDYVLSANYEQTGVYKDAKGVAITPVYGYGESDIINTFAKLGWNINDQNRVEVMYNYFGSKQNSEYVEQIGKYGVAPTIGVKGDSNGEDEGTRYNHNAYIKYQAKKLFANTSFEANAYLQKFYTVYGWSASFVPASQSAIHSEKKGARFTFNTPLKINKSIESEVLYGLDYLHDVTWQSLTDGRIWVPKMELANPAPFAQIQVVIHKDWIVKAGYRLDQVDLNIPSFTQIHTSQSPGGQQINGGKLNFSASTFNAGIRYSKWETFKPFVSFTQGFSMVDIGHYIRSAKENDIAKMQLEPVVANNYEAGFSSSLHNVSLSTSVYASTSKIGTTIIEGNGFYVQQRAPERIMGIEGSINVASIKNFVIGTGISYMEGKADINKNKSYDDPEDVYLSGRRITPLKIISHIKYMPGTRLFADVEWLYSGSRKKFAAQQNGTYKFGEGPVTAYGIINLSAGYKMKNGIQIFGGFENLLNKDYFNTTAQWYALPANYVKANGIHFQVGIGYKW